MPHVLPLFFLFLLPLLVHTCTEPVTVVLAHSRSSALKKTLRSLPPQLPHLYVSVDDNPKAARVLRSAHSFPSVVAVWHHFPSATYPAATPRERIARHYHFALSRAFAIPNVSHAILLEDDLLLAPDAFVFLRAAAAVLTAPHRDALVCASAWNDNGKQSHADDRRASLTTFFPGLGWMLSRFFWEGFLQPHWPGAPDNKGRAIVGIGWDYWLRVQFERYGWSCLTPDVPRVFHFGVHGANVGAHEAAGYFAHARLANVSEGVVDWDKEVRRVGQPGEVAREVQKRLAEGRVVSRAGEGGGVMGYRRETYRESVAEQLGLWPTPRGHFRHTLVVEVGDGEEVLLFDERRAAKYFHLPMGRVRSGEVGVVWQYEYAERNVSCDEACESRGMVCTPAVLEEANSCDSLAQVVPDGCQAGCAYETGTDLPVRVDDHAPLQTAGLCLIAEAGLGRGGKLDCGGRYEWTRRVCGCLQKLAEDSSRDEL